MTLATALRGRRHSLPNQVLVALDPATRTYGAVWITDSQHRVLLVRVNCQGRTVWGPPAFATAKDYEGSFGAARRAVQEVFGVSLPSLQLVGSGSMDFGDGPSDTGWYTARIDLPADSLTGVLPDGVAYMWMEPRALRTEAFSNPGRFAFGVASLLN